MEQRGEEGSVSFATKKKEVNIFVGPCGVGNNSASTGVIRIFAVQHFLVVLY